jgi:hypothetical protein
MTSFEAVIKQNKWGISKKQIHNRRHYYNLSSFQAKTYMDLVYLYLKTSPRHCLEQGRCTTSLPRWRELTAAQDKEEMQPGRIEATAGMTTALFSLARSLVSWVLTKLGYFIGQSTNFNILISIFKPVQIQAHPENILASWKCKLRFFFTKW